MKSFSQGLYKYFVKNEPNNSQIIKKTIAIVIPSLIFFYLSFEEKQKENPITILL